MCRSRKPPTSRHTSAAPSADPSPPFFLFFIAKSSHNPTQHNKKTSGRAGGDREYGDRFAIAGIGGVFTPQQAYEKIRCGSSLVMFISALMYRGPQQITVLKRGLAELLRRDGFEHVSEAVGIDA